MRGEHETNRGVCEAGPSGFQGGFDFGADQRDTRSTAQSSTQAAHIEEAGTGNCAGLEEAGQVKVKCVNCRHIDLKKYPAHTGVGLGMCRRREEIGLFMSYMRERECKTYLEI